MGKKECDRCGAPHPADKLHHITLEVGASERGRPILLESYVCTDCYGDYENDAAQRETLNNDLLPVRDRRKQGVSPPYL